MRILVESIIFSPLLFCKNLKLFNTKFCLKNGLWKVKLKFCKFLEMLVLFFFVWNSSAIQLSKIGKVPDLANEELVNDMFSMSDIHNWFQFLFSAVLLFFVPVFFLVFYCILIMYSSILICFEFHRKPLELIIHPRISAYYILLQCFGELPVFQNRGSSANANCLTVGLSILNLRKITGLLFVLQEHLSYYYIKEHRKQTALSDHSPLP